ncbi:helix-turn-helix domain-containing protein [Streptomyces sp. MUM 203J]|uniref:helix-turn-helix domain-containing protein n=1 Tax=Streptomyces sp. MUM 203J TaxID=2791990 RepID=UPI001F04C025|nr:helix-turn-helix domain-containing protein [Streptomyces sp. MUM 203J]MCH0541536.1 helix-turn-helix domain-containing protein [Streptomyces sp. MUM 203J]
MNGGYRERPSRLPGAAVWTVPGGRAPQNVLPVLPDGCMDLLWREGVLLVAGPDTRAYDPEGGAAAWAGVRFAPGDAPALLGVPAHELRDRRVLLADLWPAPRVRRLAAGVTGARELEALALRLAAGVPPADPLVRAVAARLGAGWTVAATAGAVGLSARQLHRRSLDAFGYGPKTLARILRLQRALGLARGGTPPAEAAVVAGCADQAHLSREARALTGRTLTACLGPPPLTAAARHDAASAKSWTPRPSGSSTTA